MPHQPPKFFDRIVHLMLKLVMLMLCSCFLDPGASSAFVVVCAAFNFPNFCCLHNVVACWNRSFTSRAVSPSSPRS